MRATSEGERGRPLGAAACLAVAALILGACGSLDQVKRAVDPWYEGESGHAGAPPTPTGPAEPPDRPAEADDSVLATPIPPPGESAEGPDEWGTPPVIEIPAPGARGRWGADEEGRAPSPSPAAMPRVPVALLLPLSGPHRDIGQSLLQAAELALFSMGGPDFALLPLDTAGTPEGAAAAAYRALGQGARLILGPLFAGSVKAVTPIARSQGVPVVSFSNDRTVAGDGVYVMGFAPETQIRSVLTYARDRGIQRLAAVLPDGPFGDRVEQTLYALTPYLGIEVVDIARHAGATTDDLSPVVKRLARYDERHAALLARRRELEREPGEAAREALKRLENLDTLGDVPFDAVFLPQGDATLRVLAPLLAFYDIDPRKVRMLGTVAWDDPSLATEPALMGGWFPAPPPAARSAFEAAYERAFGSAPPRIAALAYDATALAAVIARRSGPYAGAGGSLASASSDLPFSRPAPGDVYSVDALTATNGFAGAGGIFRLLPSGLVERGLAVMEVGDRRFDVVSPAPTTFERFGH